MSKKTNNPEPMIRLKHFLATVCAVLAVSASAQTDNIKYRDVFLSAQEKESLKEGMKELVDQFNDHISEIWRQPTRVESLDESAFYKAKDEVVNNALGLVINMGGDVFYYDTVETLVNGKYEKKVKYVLLRDGAKMEVTSVNNRTPRMQYITAYLDKIKKPSKYYSRVEVTSSEACYVNDIVKVADGLYSATLSFYQEFRGYSKRLEGKLAYGDRTVKHVTVYLFKKLVLDEVVWHMAIGDIKAVGTERLRQ